MITDKSIKPARRGIIARLAGCFTRFGRNHDGSTAIEFTLLAIPFSMLVFAILESCISFAAQEVMTNATDDVARQLRTGQLRAADVTETSLKKAICDRMEIMVAKGCPDLDVDLREFPTFTAAAAVKVKLTGAPDIDTTGFDVEPGRAAHQEHAQGVLPLAGHHRFHELGDVEPHGQQDAAFRNRHLAERTVRQLTGYFARSALTGRVRQCLNMRGRMAGWRSFGHGSPGPRATGEGLQLSNSRW